MAHKERSNDKRSRGTFWLKIDSRQSSESVETCPPYTFDGPIRFTRFFSPTVGKLTNLNDQRLYSTWKISLKGVPRYFGNTVQGWNHKYHAAQTIFGTSTSSYTVRQTIRAGHRLLYARSTRNGSGTLETLLEVFELLHSGGQRTIGSRVLDGHRVKPAVYTYVIAVEDDSFRFSETGAAFFVDFASKHALHANCAEVVRYSGEFHPRPRGGWANFSDQTADGNIEWELVIDNNSGTYAPDKNLLSVLQSCLAFNFPQFTIIALDREDPALKESVEACRDYALKNRGVKSEELQPHINQGEETLMTRAGSLRRESTNPDSPEDTSRLD